ncbi:MAG: YdeI/OmpD-associated family protein [Bacteroidota bacterium]
MSDATEHDFPTPVLEDPETEAGYMHHYVPIPAEVAAALDADGVTHVEGTLDAGSGTRPFRRALHRQPDGSLRLKFGAGWLREAGAAVGNVARVTLHEDPDPGRVDMPGELSAALDLDPEASKAWAALSPSRRKTHAYHVGRAKRTDTRIRRALSILDEIKRSD